MTFLFRKNHIINLITWKYVAEHIQHWATKVQEELEERFPEKKFGMKGYSLVSYLFIQFVYFDKVSFLLKVKLLENKSVKVICTSQKLSMKNKSEKTTTTGTNIKVIE